MAAGNFVVVRRTISQTIVPYKDVEERLLLKRIKAKSTSLGFNSTNNVARCGLINTSDTKKGRKTPHNLGLERSRSEVCLRRRSSNVRETSLDVFEERREEGFVKPVVRRREGIRRVNTTRPQSDLFPEFSVASKKTERAKGSAKEKGINGNDAEKRLGRCIATLRREMMSLRRQDQELLKQLTSLNEHIQDLKEIARVQGGIIGSTVDHEDNKQQSASISQVSPNGPLIETSSMSSDNVENSAKNDSRERSVKNDKKERSKNVKKITKNEENVGKRVMNDIQGLQETSFEYIEIPCDTVTPKAVRPRPTTKRSQSTMISDVSRKKVACLSLERKSMSCQFLDSSRRDDFKGKRTLFSESQETLASVDTRKARHFSQSNGDKPKEHADTKQKSLSLSQLRAATKTAEGSTSDSECSTSGCYGGSSTGSEAELERNIGYFNSRPRESSEKLDKVFELNLKPVGRSQRYLAIDGHQHGQFRKKIVSV